jgi:ribosomal protein S27AE
MRDVVKGTRSVIVVRCLSCQHRGIIAEHGLVRFGLNPGAPIAQFVKRLRCRKCGSGSVMARRSHSRNAVA